MSERWSFDPARESAVLGLAAEALGSANEAAEAQELCERALGYADQPLEAIGRERLLEFVGAALRAGEGMGTPETLERAARRRGARRAGAQEALPVTVRSETWQVAVMALGCEGDQSLAVALRSGGLEILEAMSVAWPPAGAARVWHPPRASTVQTVRALGAGALSGGCQGLDPEELSDLIEDPGGCEEDLLPEELLEQALMAQLSIGEAGVERGVEEIVRCCAEINRLLAPDREEFQLPAVVDEAAAVVDGAGFGGGATASLKHLVGKLLVDLACVPGGLGRAAARRSLPWDAAEAESLHAPREAMRTALVALWVRRQQAAEGVAAR